jgi:Fic family protein
MKPPFSLNTKILNLVAEISGILGNLETIKFTPPNPVLRRKNRIKTVKSTLAIEGNSLVEEQITAILEKKRVLGSKKEILEVQNAIALYESMEKYEFDSLKDFLKAHLILMKDLIIKPGNLRDRNVGILKGTKVKHLAPGPKLLPELMEKLFKWIKEEKELHPLIMSSVVHYEIEFIHPFEDGNGRIGRFWQTLILVQFNEIFRYLPVESLIEKNQSAYYETLEKCDKKGDATGFIEYMLPLIKTALVDYSKEITGLVVSTQDRLDHARIKFGKKNFTRKDYMILFKSISPATASRDLKKGADLKILEKKGEKNQANYKFN